MTDLDLKKRIEAERARDVPGGVCPLTARCSCPTCGATELLLRAKLLSRGVPKDTTPRVSINASACGDGSYPFSASVRVDGREVYRIMREPSEVFDPDVMDDIVKALGRPL